MKNKQWLDTAIARRVEQAKDIQQLRELLLGVIVAEMGYNMPNDEWHSAIDYIKQQLEQKLN